MSEVSHIADRKREKDAGKPDTRLADLVALAYEAACDTDGIQGFVESADDYFRARDTTFLIWPTRRPDSVLIVTHGVSVDEIRKHFDTRNYPDQVFGQLFVLPAGQTLTAGMDLNGNPIDTDNGNQSPDIYLMAGIVAADKKNRGVIIFCRNAEDGPFSASDENELKTVIGYFARAIALNQRFVKIYNQNKTTQAVLNNAPRGIITIGQLGQVIHLNDEAHRILGQADGLSMADSHLNFYDSDVREEVENFYDYARLVGEAQIPKKRLTISVKRRSALSAYQMMVYSLPFKKSQAELNDDEALTAIIIYDPASGIDLKMEGLQTFYGLSAAEARLAEILAHGDALPDAANSLGISINTARSQLRGIFKKVGVKSQAGLVKEFAKALKIEESTM